MFYQIAPISFQDSNGDGKGDLPGLLGRADYLKWLGVDAVWITPFFPSPLRDLGYDIAEFCEVDPVFGSLADFDRLLVELHACDIKLIIDFVPNHTSDQHSGAEVCAQFPRRLPNKETSSTPCTTSVRATARSNYLYHHQAHSGWPPEAGALFYSLSLLWTAGARKSLAATLKLTIGVAPHHWFGGICNFRVSHA